MSLLRLRQPRGGLTAGQKSAEGIIGHVVGKASGPSQLKSWIQGFKLDACVGGCELPIGFGVMFISPFLPCGGFFGEGFAVRDPAVETLADENSDLGLGHVEPADRAWAYSAK